MEILGLFRTGQIFSNHLIIELGEYNYNNGIANVDNDNVIENGNVDGGGNVVGCGNVEKIHEFSLPPTPPTSQSTSSPNHHWWYNHDYKPTIDE